MVKKIYKIFYVNSSVYVVHFWFSLGICDCEQPHAKVGQVRCYGSSRNFFITFNKVFIF